MQITLDLPDSLTQTDTFNQSDWLREIAITLFKQERISLSRASKIAGIDLIEFQKLIADRSICVHYDVEDFEQDVYTCAIKAGYDRRQPSVISTSLNPR